MQVEVAATDVKELPADERGRVYLGSEYGDKTVTVAVLDVDDE